MRVFQNSGCIPVYLNRLNKLAAEAQTFAARLEAFFNDGYAASHLLLPITSKEEGAFFTNGDDSTLQRMWADEHGMRRDASLADILSAQLEEHKPDVFYNLDPILYGSDFISRVPGCVKQKIAWRGVPVADAVLRNYDLVVCNFPTILKEFGKSGLRTAYFSPSHSPLLDHYAANRHRPIDVLFIGGFSRHHMRRAEVLEQVAILRDHLQVVFHLDVSRLVRIAESPVGRCLPLSKHRRPAAIRAVGAPPIFGSDLYSAISNAKIVINGAIDTTGNDRGNMRCFEAMGCGALLVSDEGNYPPGFDDGEVMLTYSNANEAARKVDDILRKPEYAAELATKGHAMIRDRYSKKVQWDAFLKLAEMN